MGDVLNGEFENYLQVRASHLSGQMQKMDKSCKQLCPNPYYKQKERTNRKNRNVLSFSVGFQFRVMRLALLAVMSLHSKRYDMIAHQILNLGVAQS